MLDIDWGMMCRVFSDAGLSIAYLLNVEKQNRPGAIVPEGEGNILQVQITVQLPNQEGIWPLTSQQMKFFD